MLKEETYSLQFLVEEIKNNNREAFKQFFLLMQPSIFHFLYRITSDKVIAEDLTQETFIKFWLKRDTLDCQTFPKAYIYKIARNLAINHLTQKSRIKKLNDNENLSYLSGNAETDLEKIFLRDECQKAINVLPERCKTTFILSRYDGFSYSEIAEIMQVSLQTVKNQMNKAISVLKKRLSSQIF